MNFNDKLKIKQTNNRRKNHANEDWHNVVRFHFFRMNFQCRKKNVQSKLKNLTFPRSRRNWIEFALIAFKFNIRSFILRALILVFAKKDNNNNTQFLYHRWICKRPNLGNKIKFTCKITNQTSIFTWESFTLILPRLSFIEVSALNFRWEKIFIKITFK